MKIIYYKSVKIFCILLALFFLLAGILYWIGSEQMESVQVQTASVTPLASDGGLAGTHLLLQKFRAPADTLDQLLLFTGTFGRVNQSTINLQIYEGETQLWTQDYSAEALTDLAMNAFPLNQPLTGVKGKELTLQILVVDVPAEQAISFYFGNSISAGKMEAPVNIEYPLIMNGQTLQGSLCMSLMGRDLLSVKKYYWPSVLALALAGTLWYWCGLIQYRQGKRGLFGMAVECKRYFFLMKQLVARDFKTKYKRSFLGVLWSFLNPLLTMGVQYLVFSSLFQSNIENFAVYLMTGGIIFNFFSEAVGLGLLSIVANAPLITKVYVPKYIYPVSRVLSSTVNVLISMIPLGFLTVLSGIPFRKSFLLCPMVLLYTTIFCIGMSLILSSMMVFFRDTQFLWGVLSMLWMYMTPIFYPESIIPQQFLQLYHMNPLYQFICFMREIIINGTAPGPDSFFYCTLASFIPLLIGVWVFRKFEDRFVFYL